MRTKYAQARGLSFDGLRRMGPTPAVELYGSLEPATPAIKTAAAENQYD